MCVLSNYEVEEYDYMICKVEGLNLRINRCRCEDKRGGGENGWS